VFISRGLFLPSTLSNILQLSSPKYVRSGDLQRACEAILWRETRQKAR
jgi:hypothetical protein